MFINRRRRALSIVLAAAATMVVTLPVGAADSVSQTITAAVGGRSASVANLALPSVGYSNNAQTSTGSMTLTADDSSGTNLGWNVTILSSAFVYSGANSGSNIPAANFSLTSAAAPNRVSGQVIDATGGPNVPTLVSPIGTLDSARKTLHALALFGKGTYTQALGVSLDIPAGSVPGTYTATLTTTISAAP